LTCVFWAENEKNKCNGKSNRKNKGNNQVASPFGLRSGLRQVGRRFRGGLERGATARGQRQRRRPSARCGLVNGGGGGADFLHCGAHGEGVSSFGRKLLVMPWCERGGFSKGQRAEATACRAGRILPSRPSQNADEWGFPFFVAGGKRNKGNSRSPSGMTTRKATTETKAEAKVKTKAKVTTTAKAKCRGSSLRSE
jgi:hypothetical protein